MNAERMTGNTETETQTELLLLHSCRLNLPPFLDIHVADHCNLGCAGCLHYAPVAPRRFLDPGEYREDLRSAALHVISFLKQESISPQTGCC